MLINTTKPELTISEFWFSSDSNPDRGSPKVSDGEKFWPWSRLEARDFRQGTTSQNIVTE